MLPGLRLRQARERLGLTYRDVERASFELAARRGRPELILHISRLADIENRGVIPGLHKLYTLAVVYHLNPLEIFRWYDVPIEDCFSDGGAFQAPHTHLAAPPVSLKTPLRFDPAFDPKRTELLSRMVEQWGSLEGVLTDGDARHRRAGLPAGGNGAVDEVAAQERARRVVNKNDLGRARGERFEPGADRRLPGRAARHRRR